MTFDELWRQNLPRKDPLIFSNDRPSEGSSFRNPGCSESVFEDLDETEMNRFIEWLERTLLSDDLDDRGA